jgi:glutamate carboxypeptidase
MHPLLAFARSKQSEIIAMIREFVECESPSDHPPSVNRFVDLVASKLDGSQVRTFPGGRFGRHLRAEFPLPGPRKPRDGRILALGHSDTVWPLGTLQQMPFREKNGRLWGPGVLDMKSGIVFFLFALRALRELNIPVARRVVLQVNSDEEVGSDSARNHGRGREELRRCAGAGAWHWHDREDQDRP